jgi:hypothetical protein
MRSLRAVDAEHIGNIEPGDMARRRPDRAGRGEGELSDADRDRVRAAESAVHEALQIQIFKSSR